MKWHYLWNKKKNKNKKYREAFCLHQVHNILHLRLVGGANVDKETAILQTV